MDILRHTEHLGIRTIDSLLSLLVRLFALDRGLKPDFDTVFDEGKAIGDLLERFLARCEAGGPERALFEQAVRTMIDHEDKDGFWLQESLRERLIELTRLLLSLTPTLSRPLTTDQTRLADLLTLSYAEMQAARDALAHVLDHGDLACHANFSSLLRKCEEAELFGGLPDSAYLSKETLAECLLAKSRPRCNDEAERAFAQFKDACAEYARSQTILRPAYALAPSVQIGQQLLRDLDAVQREKGFVFGSQMAGIVGEVLDGEFGVPDAFCRLGDRLHHLLVDEFQDTSRAQWSAAMPLASECLAKGGSLFYVGDVKQAIYGWRGGDARLFDEVADDGELLAMSGGLTQDNLPHNWRSSAEIIGFNNGVFGRMGSEATARDLATCCCRAHRKTWPTALCSASQEPLPTPARRCRKRTTAALAACRCACCPWARRTRCWRPGSTPSCPRSKRTFCPAAAWAMWPCWCARPRTPTLCANALCARGCPSSRKTACNWPGTLWCASLWRCCVCSTPHPTT